MTEETASVAEAEATARTGKVKKQRPLWQEIPILLLIAAVLSFLLQTFVGRVYLIPSESMEPTLHGCAGCTGDRIAVEKISYHLGDPKPGDVVVFRAPTSSWDDGRPSIRSSNAVLRSVQNVGSVFGLVPPDENDLVKRVIATGGQTVKCCDTEGRVQVDGKPLTEPYVKSDFPFVPGAQDCNIAAGIGGSEGRGRCFTEVRVPEGHVWVMGDNRNHSADSRYHVQDELHGTVPIAEIRGKAVLRIWPLGRIGSVGSPDPQT